MSAGLGDIFGDLGAALGSEYGAVGEAVGRAAGGALDKLVDSATGLLKGAWEGIAGRSKYPDEDMRKEGELQAIARQTTGRFNSSTKYYGKSLYDSERLVYKGAYDQTIRDYGFEALEPALDLDDLKSVAKAGGAKPDSSVGIGMSILDTMDKVYEAQGKATLAAKMKAEKAAREARNRLRVPRNAARYAVAKGKQPKLGPQMAAGFAKENYAKLIASGTLPAEWADAMTPDTRALIAKLRTGATGEAAKIKAVTDMLLGGAE